MKNMFIKASKKVVSGTKTVATAVGTKIIPTMGNVAHKSEELVEGAVKFSAKVSGKVLGHVIKDVKSVGHAFKDGYTSAIQTQQVSDLHAEGYQSANSVKDEQIK